MIAPRCYTVALALLFSAAISDVSAQPSPSVCEVLASKVTPDISTQTSSDVRVSIYRQFIQDDRFSSFSTASNTKLDAGLSVVDYVDFTLGTSSDAGSWNENWSKFRSSTNSLRQFNKSLDSLTSRWNPELIKGLLEDCKPQGFYAQLTSVDPDYAGFTISIHGIGSWQLKALQLTKNDPLFSCGGAEKASIKTPIDKINTASLSCSKDPNQTLTLTISSNEGDSEPLTIYSRADALNRSLTESTKEIGALSNDVVQLKKELDGLKDRMQTTIIALNNQFLRASEYHPDKEATVGVNTGGGAGLPAVDCRGGKFLSRIQFSADTSGNMIIHVNCASVPVFSVP